MTVYRFSITETTAVCYDVEGDSLTEAEDKFERFCDANEDIVADDLMAAESVRWDRECVGEVPGCATPEGGVWWRADGVGLSW